MNIKPGLKTITALKWIFLFLAFGVCFYLVVGELLLPQDQSFDQSGYTDYSGGWNRIMEDGTKVPIEIPGRYPAERNELVTIVNTLPEDLNGSACLCFRSCKQEMNIYVDGTLRQTYSTKDTRLFGKTSAVVYVFMDLTPDDAGKEIIIETQTDSSYSGVFQESCYGDRMGIWRHFFRLHGTELIIAFFMLTLGLVSILISIALRLSYHKQVEMEYFGWCVFLAAIWLISNSAFRQLLFPNISVISDMAFFMIMLIPLAFLLFMNGVQNNRYHKQYFLAGCLDVLSFVLCTFLHVTNRVDFADSIVFMSVICVLSISLFLFTIILDVRRGFVKEYSLVAIGISVLTLAAAAQIIMYFKRTVPFNGALIAVGLIFMLLISAVNTVRDVLSMEKEKQQAVLSNETKGKFLANMSHEIRTPINAVLGMDEMILRESREPQIKEYAMDIQRAGQSLLSIINDILDFSKIESGKMEIIPVKYDFSSIIHDVSNMIRAKAHDKNLALSIDVDPELPFCLFGDEIRIRQILINLLTNAVKYTNEGSVRLAVSGSLSSDSVLLHFSVEDTGIGIKEEDMSRLFEEFERIEEMRNRHVEGSGLGMNITVRLLAMMGSHLQVESVYGKGSVFSFDLKQPVIDREPIGNLSERIRQQAEYHYSTDYTAPDARILIVDDNAVNRKVFMALLKETHIHIDEADSGAECLNQIRKNRYDIIFLDHMMPEMDGIETLHHMKEQTDHLCTETPVVALTANAISGAREMYLSEGFDSFLSKPIIPEKLEKLIRGLLPELLVPARHQAPPKPQAAPQQQALPEAQETLPKAQETLPETQKALPEAQETLPETQKALPEAQGTLPEVQQEAPDIPELPVIDGIDWSYGRLHFPNDQLLLDTALDFYRSIDTEADDLEACYRQFEKDPQARNAYRIRVHTMKSSAALIGAVWPSGTARLLENAVKSGNDEIVRHVTPAFLEEWRSYKDKLKLLVKEEEEKQEITDISVIRVCLQTLKDSMEDMDIDTADRQMNLLRQYRYPADAQKNVELLSAAVTNLDGEQTGLLAEALMAQITEWGI